MEREAIGTGETLQEAQENACNQLGIDSTEAEFEVLQMPEKKKFGLFGGNPAKVRAFVVISPAQSAADYLKSILSAMGMSNIEIEIKEIEEGAEFNLIGDNVSAIIGRRGETLDALQYLTGLVANHTDNNYYRVTLNTGNYREKREKTLDVLGRKMAFKALKSGRKQSLEPMNPYERRIIHTAVQGVNGAISWSEGENLNRHVVIGPDPKVARPRRSSDSYKGGSRRPYNKNGGYNKKPYNNRDNHSSSSHYNNRPSSENNESTNETIQRAPKNEGTDFSLYGKIDKK